MGFLKLTNKFHSVDFTFNGLSSGVDSQTHYKEIEALLDYN